MKITTWNVNGIRSLKKSVSNIVCDLCSDIVCFQETKISRSQLQEDVALIHGYTSYFSYPRKQSGYSGVATYSKDLFTPEKAEEVLSVDSPMKEDLDVFSVFGDPSKMDFEGRVMITHHLIKYKGEIKKLAVINIYCPRVDPEKPERHFYKMQFCHLLKTKMYDLCQKGSFVVIVGDLNISCSMIDHCDPGNEKEFKSSEARQWLNSFLSSEVQVNGARIVAVDAFRHFYPDKKEAYTCWNTKIGARQTNYGTRIDYVIVSSNLIPMLSKCEILSDYQGSDHCPVFAELKCDFVPELRVQLPSICTRLWPEFSGHQQKLQAFFHKTQDITDLVTNSKEDPKLQLKSKGKSYVKKNKQKAITSFFKNNTSPSLVPNPNRKDFSSKEATDITPAMNSELINLNIIDEQKEFGTSKNNTSPSLVPNPNRDDFSSKEATDTAPAMNSELINLNIINEHKEFETNTCDPRNDIQKNVAGDKQNEWKFLLKGPPKPPLCSKHKKQCVLRTVKKSGPNFGRQFFMCAQPVGATSNPESNCNFFKWASSPKLKVLKS